MDMCNCQRCNIFLMITLSLILFIDIFMSLIGISGGTDCYYMCICNNEYDWVLILLVITGDSIRNND